MRIDFVTRNNAPDRLVAEAELVFEAGEPLAGLKLVGLSLWRSPEGEVYVTLPSRAFGAGGDRRYFDYLRGQDNQTAPAKALKARIVEEWKRGEEHAREATGGNVTFAEAVRQPSHAGEDEASAQRKRRTA